MLQVRDLIKIYSIKAGLVSNRIIALNGINLTAEAGKITAIVGDSGSGKTTLINIVAGLLKPSAGEVIVDDRIKVHHLSQKQLTQYRIKYIGYMGQLPSQNLPYTNFTVKEVLELPLVLNGISREEREKKINEMLKLLDLLHLKERAIKVLSGGEAQRLALLVSIIKHPLVFLADEPTGELDEENAERLFEIIHNLTVEYNCATLVVSHDPLILKFCDRAYRLRDGVIQSVTAPNQQFTDIEQMADHLFTESFDYLSLDAHGRVTIPHFIQQEKGFTDQVFVRLLSKGLVLSSDRAYLHTLHIKEKNKEEKISTK